MSISSLGDITCDTSLDSVLKSSEVIEKLSSSIGSGSPIISNISNRQEAISNNIANGGLSTSIMIDDQCDCATYASEISSKYDACISGFASACSTIGTSAEIQEFDELKTLRTKVEEKIETIQNNISSLDKESDDYDSDLSDYRHEMRRYDYKLTEINKRIGMLSPSITGGDSSSISGGVYGSTKVLDAGSDDKDYVYGNDSVVLDDDTFSALLSSDGRSKWVLSQDKIGENGLSINGGKYFNCYNKYFTTTITDKDGNEKTVYMICPSSGFGTEDDISLQNNSEPILYITEDSSGHKVCYDKEMNPISYNNAMNVMEISRNSNPSSRGMKCHFESPEPTVNDNQPTPFCPTAEYDPDGAKYTWYDSETDVNGNAWKKYSNKTFDNSEQWKDYDLSEKNRNYNVYSKANGDAGTINVLMNQNDSETRYYSVKDSNGNYSYYDQYCNPLNEEEISYCIDRLY